MTVLDRFWSKVRVTDGCWLWLGKPNATGYGQFGIATPKGGVRQTVVAAHRFSYEISVGPIGDLNVCHHCDNPPCVNPAHLFLGTQKDNIQDMIAKGRGLVFTHCPKGHEYGPDDREGKGRHRCMTCRRAWWRSRIKAAA